MDNSLLNVFVPYIPQEGPSNRDLSLAEVWKPFVNAFNTWMEQAQSTRKLSSGLYCVRFGMLVTVTGKIGDGEKFDIVAPVATFSTGSVLFSSEGFIQNNGGETTINATYIAKE